MNDEVDAKLTEERIGEIVDRILIERAVDEKLTPGKSIWAWFTDGMGHPAMIALLGFVFTTLLGTFVTVIVDERTARANERAATAEASEAFIVSTEQARIRGLYLRLALLRGMPPETIDTRRSTYIDAYDSWHSGRWAFRYQMQGFLGYSGETPFDEEVENGLWQNLVAMDGCLDAGLKTYNDNNVGLEATEPLPTDLREQIKDAMEACARRRVQGVDASAALGTINAKIKECGARITGLARHFATNEINCRASTWTSRTRCPIEDQGCAQEEKVQAIVPISQNLRRACRLIAPATAWEPPDDYNNYCAIDDNLWTRLTGRVKW